MFAAAALKAGLLAGGVAGEILVSGSAQADQTLGPYAGDVLDQLQDWGYEVMLNGVGKDVGYLDSRERWACRVTGIHPTVTGPPPSGRFQTVYVDLSYPPSNNSPTG